MGGVLSKPAEQVIGAVGGAAAAELLKPIIEEAKKVWAFKAVSEELASTMESLVPILDSLKNDEDLKDLKVTIDEAKVLVKKCAGVSCWNVFLKNYYTREVGKIDRKMFKFCQIHLQVQIFKLVKQHKSNNNFASSVLCSVPELDMVPVGLELPLGVLRSNLLKESVNTLLVYAPPGCGKTTLVTQICHDEKIKGEFKHIFFRVVSSAPDFIKLVQDLLEHNHYSAPSFAYISQAIGALKILLEKLGESGPILLVLDDVWHGSNFSLKNFQNNDILGYKILVTSREKLLDCNFTYELKPLEPDYAKTLLIKSAPRPDEASQAEYDELIQKILKRCSGYPIVIEVVASALKGQPLSEWKGQVNSWSFGETVLNNPHDRVLKCLEPSFTFLTSPLQECFMDMGSFLEDQKIRASIIIDIWVELYGKGRSSSSNVYMKYLNDLASRSLLKLIPLERKEPEDGFYNEFLITQHDILRELAIRQSKNVPNRRRLLSISTDDSFTSNWEKAEALVLNISSSNYAIPQFILKMKKLKVVIIINHGFHPVRVSNFSCLSSLQNLKRIRLEKVSITFLEILQLQRISLEKLSLAMCSFGEVSHDTKEIVDVSKALPSLQEIDINCCYDLVELPLWLFEVVSLKTLSITNCNKLSKLPEAIGNLRNLETLRLISCISLVELPETVERLGDLRFLDVSGCFDLKTFPQKIGNLKNLKKIFMRKCDGWDLPDSVKNLENLEVKCYEGNVLLWKRFIPKMKNLTITIEEEEHNLNRLQLF